MKASARSEMVTRELPLTPNFVISPHPQFRLVSLLSVPTPLESRCGPLWWTRGAGELLDKGGLWDEGEEGRRGAELVLCTLAVT